MSAKYMIYEKNKKFSTVEDRAFAREELIFNVTEDLLIMMEDQNVSKSELARLLGKSKSFVTQVLSGARNMTLGSLSDICFALDFKPTIKLPIQEEVDVDVDVSDNGWINVSEDSRYVVLKSSAIIGALVSANDDSQWENLGVSNG